MDVWPNWVDLVVLILVLRTCYSGFARGLLWAISMLAVAISVTCLTVNYAPLVTQWLEPWLGGSSPLNELFLFWVIFLSLILAGHWGITRILQDIKWERVNWFVQGIGAVVGGLRGLWWSAFVLIVLSSSGFIYLDQSVEQESVFGRRFLSSSGEMLTRFTDRFPGSKYREVTFVPPIKPSAARRRK